MRGKLPTSSSCCTNSRHCCCLSVAIADRRRWHADHQARRRTNCHADSLQISCDDGPSGSPLLPGQLFESWRVRVRCIMLGRAGAARCKRRCQRRGKLGAMPPRCQDSNPISRSMHSVQRDASGCTICSRARACSLGQVASIPMAHSLAMFGTMFLMIASARGPAVVS